MSRFVEHRGGSTKYALLRASVVGVWVP
jgi:hypothetical protein